MSHVHTKISYIFLWLHKSSGIVINLYREEWWLFCDCFFGEVRIDVSILEVLFSWNI